MADADQTSLRLVSAAGDTSTVVLSRESLQRDVEWVYLTQQARSPALRYRYNATGSFEGFSRTYWMTPLVEENALYVQINRMVDDEEETLAAFARRVDSALTANAFARIVLDLRWNIGGNYKTALPLVNVLIKHEQLAPDVRLVGLIGRATLSATVVTLDMLKRHTNIVLVGEPTGAHPNLYDDNLYLELPHSKLHISVSSEYYQAAGPIIHGSWIAPEVAVKGTSSAIARGEDSELEAALAYDGPVEVEPHLRQQLLERFGEGGIDAAIVYYRAVKQANPYIDTFRPVRRFGDHLLDEGHLEEAQRVYALNHQAYPERARSYISLGYGYQTAGEAAVAEQFYLRGLELLPGDASLYTGLKYALENWVYQQLDTLRAGNR